MQKVKNFKPKTAFNKIIKFILLTLLLVFSYYLSFKVDGFYKTNIKAITIIVFSILGFVSFFLGYYVFKIFYLISYNKKRKKLSKSVVNCDDELSIILQDEKFIFKYDKKLDLKANLKNASEIIINLVKDVSAKFGKNGKFFYVKYTVYDALTIFENAVDGIHNKLDGYFKFFKLQDKPLSIVEKSLSNLLNQSEINVEEIEVEKGFFSKVKNKLTNGAKTVGFFFIKGKIEGAVNDVVSFVGAEAFRVYSKDYLLDNSNKSEDKV